MMFYEVFIPSNSADEFDITITVEADNWMLALKSGLERTGSGADIRNVMCDIKDDNTIHVTDATTRRVFVLRELNEEESEAEMVAVDDVSEMATQRMDALPPRHAPPPNNVRPPTGDHAATSHFERSEVPTKKQFQPPPAGHAPPPTVRESGQHKSADAADTIPPTSTPPTTGPPPGARPPSQQNPAVTQRPAFEEPRSTSPRHAAPSPQAQPAAEPVQQQPAPPPQPAAPQPTPQQQQPAPAPQETRQQAQPEADRSAAGESWTSEDGRMRIGSSTFEALRRDEPEPRVLRETRAPSGQREAVDIGRVSESVSQSTLEEVFLEINQIHEGGMSMEQVINFVMDLCMGKISAEAGSVMFADVNGRELYFATARGPKAHEVMDFRVPMTKGIVGFCAREGVSLAISDAENDPRFYKAISEALGYETQNICCAPVQFEGRVYGCIELMNKSQPFTNTEVNVLTYIGRQLAKFVHDLIMAREKLE